jgi:flagellar hook assembly protein FlgD
MKKVTALFIAAFFLLMLGNVSVKAEKYPKERVKSKLAVSFVRAEKNAIMIFYGNNTEHSRVNITIRNEKGELVYHKSLSNENYGIKYLFYDAPKGTYTLSVGTNVHNYFTKALEVL